MEAKNLNNYTTCAVDMVPTRWDEVYVTENTFMEEVKTYMTFKIANLVNTYWFPILIPIGLIGNSLSFTVMIKPRNRKMPTCIYMAAISINDNLTMLLCFHEYLVSVLHIHKWYPIECHVTAVAILFALQNCTYLILAMTIDKYIAITWPHKAATYSTPERAKLIAMVLSLCVFIYNIPRYFLSSIIGGQCLNFGIRNVFSRVYSWASFVLNAVIPFAMLIHMNYVIVTTVRNSKNMLVDTNTSTGTTANQGMETRRKIMKSAESQLTIMMLLVTTLFLILLFPTYFRFIYLVFAERDTPIGYAKSMLIFQISFKFYATNSGINFLLYCISGKKFRNDLKEILCCFNISNGLVTERTNRLQTKVTESTCTGHT